MEFPLVLNKAKDLILATRQPDSIDDWQELRFLSALPWTGLPLEVWDRVCKRIALIDVRFPAELVIRYQADAIVFIANAIHTCVNRSLCTDISHSSACEPKVLALIIVQIFSLKSNGDYISECQSSQSLLDVIQG